MVLNDVWRTIGSEVGFYYEKTFDDVPSSSGVYAWFYPLKVLSRSPEDLQRFVADVQALLNYDSVEGGPPRGEAELPFAWWNWQIRATRMPKQLQVSALLALGWAEVAASDTLFSDFQQTLLKASILMPPLYVGKADKLNVRCGQHLAGTQGANDFHHRFEAFARNLDLRFRSVRELVFACVRTGPSSEEGTDQPSPVHQLVEGIMKSICAPPYGMR